MLYLNIPYSEKDKAKEKGAQWNPLRKKWYIRNRFDYPKFSKWIRGEKEEVYVICDCFYIVISSLNCYKCKKETPVIGFGVEQYYNFWDPEVFDEPRNWYFEFFNNGIQIASGLDFPFKKSFSATLAAKYSYYNDQNFSNHCSNCKSKFGNFHIFQEVESPFFINGKEDASKLQLIKVNLSEDIILEWLDLGYGSYEHLYIKKYGTIICEINYTSFK